MRIYLDLVMGLNFLVDFLLLQGTNRLSGFPTEPWRAAAAGVLGAVYSGMCLLPGFSFLGNLLWRTVSLGLMGAIAFGIRPDALKRTGLFLLLTMALGGLALSFGRGDWTGVLPSAAVVWLLCRLSLGDTGREFIPLELSRQDKSLRLTALRDSGNTLRDPVTGESVLVISPEAAFQLTGLTVQQLQHPLENLGKLPGLRLIPYHAVGNSGGFLLGLRFEDAKVGRKRRSVIAAFAPAGLGREEGWDALAGGNL